MITTVKETVRRMLIQYPMLFHNKSDCFNHLFMTNGNGYDWIDGCLIDPHSNDDQPHWADESGAADEKWSSSIPEVEELLRQQRILDAKRENAQIHLVLNNFEAIFAERVVFHNLYSVCEYSDLFHMPDDVQPDWRKACNETSRAVNIWLYQRNEWRSIEQTAQEQMEKLNRQFREQHFTEEDARIYDLSLESHENNFIANGFVVSTL